MKIARRLEDAGAVVDVALTPSAARFIPPLTFRSLVQGEVAADLWDPAAPAEQHVAMGRRADVVVVAPASATTIAKLAYGIGDNPVTLTALASAAPLVVAPAMDAVMFAQPSVQANLELLKARGVAIAGPAEGRLASGARGLGRLLEPTQIAAAARSAIGRAQGPLREDATSWSRRAVPVKRSIRFATWATAPAARWASPWPRRLGIGARRSR